MRKDSYKVVYTKPRNDELDADIRELMKRHGYREWASGIDVADDGERDLAFDLNEDPQEMEVAARVV